MKKQIIATAVMVLAFSILFGCTANANSATGQFTAQNTASGSQIKLVVNIPCSGHSGLITGELKKINGVTNVSFSNPNIFTVDFDSTKTNKEEILEISIFKEYPAKLA